MEKYLLIFFLSFKRTLKNTKALIGLSIFLMTCLLIFSNLWKIVAAKTTILFNSEQLLWYIAFNEWVLISIPDVQDDIEQDLRSGKLAYQLPRPISYLGSTFVESFGTLSANLIVLGFVTFIFSWVQVGFPFHPISLIVSILFGFLSGVLAIIFLMLIGLSSFWVQDVAPFYWLWEKLLFMFGGLILPLTVYPQWMQIVAKITPFPAILSDRSSLAFAFGFYPIFQLFLSLVGWILFSLLCLVVLYRKSLSILNIEGG